MEVKIMPSRYRGIMGGAMPGEERQILGFFERANDPNVLPRPFEDYRRSIELGLFYTVKVDDQLIAAAGVFPLHEHKISPMEMGSCFVAPVARNFGIQKLLIRPRIAASILFYDTKIYTAVKPSNTASNKSILSAGFEPLTEPDPLLIEPCAACNRRPEPESGRICCCDFYHIPPARQCEQIRLLLGAGPSVTVSRPNGDTMSIDMHVQVLTKPEYRQLLEAFVESPECSG
jgi:hypothetical protein